MSLTSKLTTIAAAGGGGVSGWYLAFRASSTYDYAYSVKVDSGNDIYVGGYSRDSSIGAGHGGYMAKISPDAEFQWSKYYDVTTDRNYIKDFDLDGSGYIYTVGLINTTVQDIYTSKIDASTGATQWVKKTSGNSIDRVDGCTWDSNNGYLVVAGVTYSLTNQTGAYWGYVTSTGSLVDYIQKGSFTNIFYDVCISGNAYYYVGSTTASGTGYGLIQRSISNPSASLLPKQADLNTSWLACDRIGTTDAVVMGSAAGQQKVMRITSALGQVWRKDISFSPAAGIVDVCTDASDNIYLLNNISGGFGITKLDSSGNMLWSNNLSNSQGTITPQGRICVTDDEKFIHVAGYDDFSAIGATTGRCSFVVKLSTDGSGTGTSDDFTYEATSTTVSDGGTLSLSNDSLTYAGIGLSTLNPSAAVSSVTFDTNLTDL